MNCAATINIFYVTLVFDLLKNQRASLDKIRIGTTAGNKADNYSETNTSVSQLLKLIYILNSPVLERSRYYNSPNNIYSTGFRNR